MRRALQGIDGRTSLALAISLLLWGSAIVGIRWTLAHYPPGPLALMRFLTAGVTLGLYAIPGRVRVPAARDFPMLAVVGLFGVSAYHTTLNYGLVSVSAGAASMIVNTAPVWTVALASLLLRERMPALGWAGMTVSLGGAVLIALEQGKGLQLSPAAGLLLLAALSWSFNMVLQKPLLGKYTPLEVTTWSLWIGTIPLLVFAPALVSALRAAPAGATGMLVYLGVVPIGVVYVLWAYVMSRLTASRAAGFLYLIPVIATLVGHLWLGEAPGAFGVAGGALVIAGLLIVNRRPPVSLQHEVAKTQRDEDEDGINHG